MTALRLNATDPIADTVARLNDFRPDSLVGYASVHRLLAEGQLAGRLRISPVAVMSASEVLTDDTRRLVEEAWGLHLYEDLVITEVVDQTNRPVPPGTFGAKILVTVLFSRTQPLIRYEMSDSVRLTERRCPCGRPFALLDGIQGRSEDVLHLPGRTGNSIAVHPLVFHDVLESGPGR